MDETKKKQPMYIKLDADLHDALVQLKDNRACTLISIIEDALSQYFADQPEKKKELPVAAG